MTFDPAPFFAACVSIDLEVDPKSARIFAFAAVRGEAAFVHKGVAQDPALHRLEALCHGAAHLVGHNFLRHDMPHLVANRARRAGLGVAAIDTLWLNPLAFPRNPYHQLVKHYQDGRLQVGNPMHLRGHVFQVVSINGRAVNGAMRDTIYVPPMAQVTMARDAGEAARWMLHCHRMPHLSNGMRTEFAVSA